MLERNERERERERGKKGKILGEWEPDRCMTLEYFARARIWNYIAVGYTRCCYGSVRNLRAAALPKLQRMIILRCVSIAKSPDTFATEIPPILNSHRACGRLCLRIVVPVLNCKERRYSPEPRPRSRPMHFP